MRTFQEVVDNRVERGQGLLLCATNEPSTIRNMPFRIRLLFLALLFVVAIHGQDLSPLSAPFDLTVVTIEVVTIQPEPVCAGVVIVTDSTVLATTHVMVELLAAHR